MEERSWGISKAFILCMYYVFIPYIACLFPYMKTVKPLNSIFKLDVLFMELLCMYFVYKILQLLKYINFLNYLLC